jgi:hypothetical protein
MRLRVLVLLVILVALFPTPIANGCHAIVTGALTLLQQVLAAAGAGHVGQ